MPGYGLRLAISDWLADGKFRWSPHTVADRQQTMERFCWWLENEAGAPLILGGITPHLIRAFLAYVREARQEGRFGCPRSTARKEARPATVNAYFRILRAFFNWCLAEELVEATPLKNIRAPKIPNDQIQPLSVGQVQALLDAARRMRSPERNAALILLLVDTGMRVSEAAQLRIEDISGDTDYISVIGKGSKRRRV